MRRDSPVARQQRRPRDGVFAEIGRSIGAVRACRVRLASPVSRTTAPSWISITRLACCATLGVMGDQDDGVALGGQILQQRHDFRAALAVERAGGLVGEDDLAAVHQRAGDGNALLLSAGKLARAVVQPVAKAERAQQAIGARLRSAGMRPA